MQPKHLLYGIFVALFVGVLVFTPGGAAQSGTPTVILRNERVSTETGKNEVPRAAIGANELHATWKFGGNPAQTQYSTKPELGGTWTPQMGIGAKAGTGTYLTSAIAVNPVDNTPHIIWSDTSQGADGRIFYSRRQTNGVWTNPVAISGNVSRFAHYPSIAITTQGVIWALWSREANGTTALYYRFSVDNGATWQPGSEGLIDDSNAKRGFLAADKQGGIHATWWTLSNGLVVKYGRWNGSSWSKEIIPAGGKNAESTIAIDGLNNVHIVWRRERSQDPPAWDVFYATRPISGGAWNIAKLTEGGNIGQPPSVATDESNTVHVTWNAPGAGQRDLFYTRKLPGSGWLSPAINVTGNNLFNANHSLVAKSSDGSSRAHAFTETWYSGDTDVRIEHHVVASGGVTPSPTATPPPTAVDFTPTRTSPSPTKDANVTVALTNLVGSPNQIRFSATPFAANDAAPAWQTLQTSFNINVANALNGCTATIYIQARNTTTNTASTVKTIAAVVDNGIQADVNIWPMQNLPAGARPPAQRPSQPNAPDAGDPNYTRDVTFYYRISEEVAGCAKLDKYLAETYLFDPTAYPDDGFVPFNPFIGGGDSNGIGFPEQQVEATILVTDTVQNSQTFTRMFTYDDDPPILADGGSLRFPNITNNASDFLAVDVEVTASVTDDGYTNSAPADKKYWGVWIVATKTPTLPDAKTFQQYGHIRQLEPGATRIKTVLLVNDSDPNMRTEGTRFVHVRFLDGAGNYSDKGITSPEITLNKGFKGIPTFLPIIAR